jgi:hypothetical protein
VRKIILHYSPLKADHYSCSVPYICTFIQLGPKFVSSSTEQFTKSYSATPLVWNKASWAEGGNVSRNGQQLTVHEIWNILSIYRLFNDTLNCLECLTEFLPLCYRTFSNKVYKHKTTHTKYIIYMLLLLLLSGIYNPLWVWASSFLRFRDHTQGHDTVGRTPLYEWSARRRDLYLTTHTKLTTNILDPGGIFFYLYFICTTSLSWLS